MPSLQNRLVDPPVCSMCGYAFEQVPASASANEDLSPKSTQQSANREPIVYYSCTSHKFYQIAIVCLAVALVIMGGFFANSAIHLSPSSSLSGNPYSISDVRTSYNWSRFVVCCSDGSVADVIGTWTVPMISCMSNSTKQSVAIWVGIDGAHGASNTVEQIGTIMHCMTGNSLASYYAFFDWYPSQGFDLQTPRDVFPGDSITAEVRWQEGQFTASITDHTRSWTFSKSNSSLPGVTRASAEWIVEAPQDYNTHAILPLANFGKVYFSNCEATIGGKVGPMGMFTLLQDTMSTTNSTILARPVLPLWNDGTSFSVWWERSAT